MSRNFSHSHRSSDLGGLCWRCPAVSLLCSESVTYNGADHREQPCLPLEPPPESGVQERSREPDFCRLSRGGSVGSGHRFMPVRDGFEEDDTLELFFSNGWDDAVPFGTLML